MDIYRFALYERRCVEYIDWRGGGEIYVYFGGVCTDIYSTTATVPPQAIEDPWIDIPPLSIYRLHYCLQQV